MGLDQYLYRTKKVKGLTTKDYVKADDAICDVTKEKLKTIREHIKGKSKKAYSELDEVIKVRGSENFHWLSIFEDVGCWRKANQIHSFFVRECQNGEDNCQLTRISEYKLNKLMSLCKQAITYKEVYLNDGIIQGKPLEEILPTADGFFFGGTEFDEWYFQDIEETIEILTKVLKETDFETQTIFYRASW
jgi:hypothetical protein